MARGQFLDLDQDIFNVKMLVLDARFEAHQLRLNLLLGGRCSRGLFGLLPLTLRVKDLVCLCPEIDVLGLEFLEGQIAQNV
jgi:hypothetical protein